MTIDEEQERIIEEFARLEGPMARYERLVELSGKLEPLCEEWKTPDNLVSGCRTSLWLSATMEGGLMRIRAESEAKITAGIIALIVRVLDGRPPEQVASAELYFLDRTGLSSSLSPARAGGVSAVVERIGFLASRLAGGRS